MDVLDDLKFMAEVLRIGKKRAQRGVCMRAIKEIQKLKKRLATVEEKLKRYES